MFEQLAKGRGGVFQCPEGLNRFFPSPDSQSPILPKGPSQLFIQVQTPWTTFTSLFPGLPLKTIVNIVVAYSVPKQNQWA